MADVWLDGTPSMLWRRHSDAVNLRLLAGWLGGDLGAVLKTDLFDEAISQGLGKALAASARSVTGIDINARIVEAAHRRYPEITALEADVRALPFREGSFDTVISNSTLDHFDEPAEIEASLRELSRVLAPGGRLLVTLDNPRNPVVAVGKALRGRDLNRSWTRAGGRTARVGLVPYYVGATLDTPALVEALERSGLVVVDGVRGPHRAWLRSSSVASSSGLAGRPPTSGSWLRSTRASGLAGRLPGASPPTSWQRWRSIPPCDGFAGRM